MSASPAAAAGQSWFRRRARLEKRECRPFLLEDFRRRFLLLFGLIQVAISELCEDKFLAVEMYLCERVWFLSNDAGYDIFIEVGVLLLDDQIAQVSLSEREHFALWTESQARRPIGQGKSRCPVHGTNRK